MPDLAKTSVIVVDDDLAVCKVITAGLSANGIVSRTFQDPNQAREYLTGHPCQILICDVVMPDLSGFDLLMHVRQSSPGCKVILMTGYGDTRTIADALSLGAYDYLQKPFDIRQLVETIDRAMQIGGEEFYLPIRAAKAMQMEAQIHQASLESIRALVHAVEAKDDYTRRHSEQVRHYAVSFAEFLGIDSVLLDSIRVASLLHDIGKIGIPDSILTKPGPLDSLEFAQICRHPGLGSEILEHISMFAGEAKLVRHHHERWDGAGYPDNLSSEDIPLGARIICAADSLDAMLMRRSYKDCYPLEKVLAEFHNGLGTQFDPDIAVATIEWIHAHPNKLILPAEAA